MVTTQFILECSHYLEACERVVRLMRGYCIPLSCIVLEKQTLDDWENEGGALNG